MRIIVTKIDACDPDVVGEDVKKTYHSSRLLTLMEVSTNFWTGITMSDTTQLHADKGSVHPAMRGISYTALTVGTVRAAVAVVHLFIMLLCCLLAKCAV